MGPSKVLHGLDLPGGIKGEDFDYFHECVEGVFFWSVRDFKKALIDSPNLPLNQARHHSGVLALRSSRYVLPSPIPSNQVKLTIGFATLGYMDGFQGGMVIGVSRPSRLGILTRFRLLTIALLCTAPARHEFWLEEAAAGDHPRGPRWPQVDFARRESGGHSGSLTLHTGPFALSRSLATILGCS